MKIVAIIQARMSSTRLPGKVLADIAGRPMLLRVVDRVKQAKSVSKVLVATSTATEDSPIAELCSRNRIPCFRGSLNDVLDRFHQAAIVSEADAVVRITADCPLIDPGIIDEVIDRFRKEQLDYCCNFLPYVSFPDGLDVEVFSSISLQTSWQETTTASDREHVTPYLRNSGRFTIGGIVNPQNLSHLRWTVDDPEDLVFIRRVQEVLGDNWFTWKDVVDLVSNGVFQQGSASGNEGYCRSLFEQATAGSAPKRNISKSMSLFDRAGKVIPGASQTFSKGPSQYVQGVSPVFLERGQGCRVWDVDGNEYIDYVQGLLPNILGYAHPEVNDAYSAQLSRGHSFSLPHPMEVELAERLVELIPCAEMVRFGKNGSDATAGAVRIARAFTGRERLATCGYHGWQDWYIGSTTRNAGVPKCVRELTHTFPYNDAAKLDELLSAHSNEFAAVILEPVNFTPPNVGYLEEVKAIAHRHGAVLIFDEICSGFHFGLGGAQKRFGVTPDLACFGKAMGNGLPISCVVGRSEVMRQFEDAFVSFTFAGEVASMAAALKVLEILETSDALQRMHTAGRTLQDGFNSLAKCAGLSDRLKCIGYPEWPLMKFLDRNGKDCLLTRSLFQQEAVKRGILHLVTFNLSAAHDGTVVDRTLCVFAAVIKTLAGWLNDSNPERFLEGPAITPVFKVR